MGKIVGTGGAYYFGDENITPFRGTIRTLDGVNGAKELPPSIMSNRRMTHFDDSESLALTDDFCKGAQKRHCRYIRFRIFKCADRLP
ncbi:MAG: hypothetical protein L6V93_19740 [Clostridiales bacterium]|nr:MAG: hypothetical protein L6V93_19740 [Clostridiales bacterium]